MEGKGRDALSNSAFLTEGAEIIKNDNVQNT